MKKPCAWMLSAGLVLLFGLAVWFRVSSLETLPETDGDEAWHAIQLAHMLRGETFSIRTEHGLPLSPFHAILELPLLLIAGPSTWLLRVPTVLTGLLAIVLTYVLGSRILDRTTALIASAALAALPVAIIFARTGYESGHAPLYGILLLYFAYRVRMAGMIALLLSCYFVHPTNIFLLPVVLAVMSFRALRDDPTFSDDDRRRLPVKMAVLVALTAAIGLFTMLRPITDKLAATYHLGLRGPHDWFHYWALFGRLFLATGRVARPLRDWGFWLVVTGVLVPGTAVLVRNRRWDRLAMIAGTILSAVALFLMGSSDILQPGITRYGFFLVVPSVLSFACLVRALLVESSGGWRKIVLGLQYGSLLALGFVVILGCDLRRLTLQVLDAEPSRMESVWTLRSDVRDARQKTLGRILREIDRGDRDPARISTIITPDFMTYRSFQYLALPRRDVKVVEFGRLGPPEKIPSIFWRQLQSGAFAVLPPGHSLEQAVKGMLASPGFDSWVVRRGDVPAFTIYRVHREPEAPGRVAARPNVRR